MKKLLFVLFAGILGTTTFAQSEKYVKAMENLVPAVDTTRSVDGMTELAASFERIATAEKTQWLPYYYAALCYVNIANSWFSQNQFDKIDPPADKAEPLMKKAEELEKNNSEILCLKKMYNSAKLTADIMGRYMTYGPLASEALEQAKKLDPENPRTFLLEGIDKMYTPEQFGGSKTEAKVLFETAIKKFEAFKPASSIHPSWGLAEVKYFLSQL
ncbi:MAG TPA: hypothetical protein VLJ68_10385 [Chitinophagaceae bacterium]|nr:hypothetical protein [Chitinophagaceae bacterium]